MEIPFLQAKYFTTPTAPRKVDTIVIHAADVVESPTAAEWLMKYCAANDRQSSWNYAVDSDHITQSVKEEHVAWHAPGANARGIGIELATSYAPSAAQWAAPYSQKMLTLAAWLAAGICARWKIEPFFVDFNGLLEGRRGITTHAQATLAYKRGDHMDPGPNFPMNDFLAKVKSRLDTGNFEA